MKKQIIFFMATVGFCVAVFSLQSCKPEKTPDVVVPSTAMNPASDPKNTANWTLNTDISDEFEDTKLDETKWLVQGTGGVFRSNFIGRAPSQFSTGNVRVENGKLKLQTKWEPTFNFSTKLDNGTKYENITTAAVISKKQFLYGYMEIKCKAADASITSSFWTTGTGSELDVFEFLAKPKQTNKTFLETELWSSIHDWSQAGGPSVWTNKHQLPWRVGSAFHVYGCEWDENYLKIYADGQLVKAVTKAELGAAWVIKNPLWVWVDSETFPWHGIPVKEDLPVDYEVEYIRVWQKK